MSGQAGHRSVLGRAAIVLDAFVDESVLSLAELTAATRLPRSTAYRFAEQLVGIGWLERVPLGYRVGMRLFEIGGRASSVNRLRGCAAPWLLQAQQQSKLAVHLGVLDGNEVVYLDRLVCSQFPVPSRPGARRPAHCTGLGKAMLAFEPAHRIEEVLAERLCRVTPSTVVSPDALRASLDRAAVEGVATEEEEAVPGLACVAAPIRGSGRAIGGISVVGPSRDFDFRRNAAIVKRAAAGVWSDLFPSSRTA